MGATGRRLRRGVARRAIGAEAFGFRGDGAGETDLRFDDGDGDAGRQASDGADGLPGDPARRRLGLGEDERRENPETQTPSERANLVEVSILLIERPDRLPNDNSLGGIAPMNLLPSSTGCQDPNGALAFEASFSHRIMPALQRRSGDEGVAFP